MKKWIILGIVACLILGIGASLFCAFDHRLGITHYTISSSKVTNHVRLAMVSDLHSCRYGEGQAELCDAIASQNPDAVMMVGDIAEDFMPHEGTIDFLRGLDNQYPAFYVTGNHEYWSGEVDRIKQFFIDYDVTVLENEHVLLEIKGQTLNICGVEDPDSRIGTPEGDLEQAFAGIDPAHYTILLAHRPELIENYLQYPCDLILSGHAHGGQMRIPFFVPNGLYAPNQGSFPKYTNGVHVFDDTNLIIGRGLSRESSTLPRVFNPPELVIIDIVPAS